MVFVCRRKVNSSWFDGFLVKFAATWQPYIAAYFTPYGTPHISFSCCEREHEHEQKKNKMLLKNYESHLDEYKYFCVDVEWLMQVYIYRYSKEKKRMYLFVDTWCSMTFMPLKVINIIRFFYFIYFFW